MKNTEYRVTRPNLYDSSVAGYLDKSVRQGHYVVACSLGCAHKAMQAQFPSDSHFDVEIWKDQRAFGACHSCGKE